MTPIERSVRNEIAEEHDRDGCRSGRVAALDTPVDVDRRDLGLERDVPGDDHERPELADGLREREGDAGEDPRAGCSGGRSPEGRRGCEAPSECAASSTSGSSSWRTGCTVRTTKGSVTNMSARTIAGSREGDVDADRRRGPVEGEQSQAGDDRRKREREVDDRVHDDLPAELVPHEHPRRDRPEHGVQERTRPARRRA